MRNQSYDEAKFAELLLHLAKRCESDPWFGAVKLHKLLYYAEFRAFRELGHPITGVPFQNLENGPAAKRLLPVQRQLIEMGRARLDSEPTPAGVQKRLVALRKPDLSAFSEDEKNIIEAVVAELWGKTASETSADSHEEPGWIATSEREPIPYHMALLSRPHPSAADEAFAAELAARGALPRRS